jgi:8-oxo-dGTP pyrophosphatase MutT (NUDIX family)
MVASQVPQAGAIPVRDGRICMIRSRGGKGLVIPKGRLEFGRTPEQMALQEAWEEAGVIGILLPKAVGWYRYEKAGRRFEVLTFLMEVTNVANQWPECRWRSRHWMLPAEALTRVRHRFLVRWLAAKFTHSI